MIPVDLIRRQDYSAIVDWAMALTEEQRLTTLQTLREKEYAAVFAGEYVHDAFDLLRVVCTRTLKELRLFPAGRPARLTLLHTLLHARHRALHDALFDYVIRSAPDYLDKVVQEALHGPQSSPDFRLLWRLRQQGRVTFDEASFAGALLNVEMFTRSVNDELDYLRAHPQVIEQVLLPFVHHEVPVLLRSKWQNAGGETDGGIVTEFWNAVLAQLYVENRLPRRLIADLLASLSIGFKKGRLDWHIRILKMFAPDDKEWLEHQHLLLATFYASPGSVLNFVLPVIQKISVLESFDRESFMQHLPILTGRENVDKSLLIALNIADAFAERFPPYRTSLAQTVCGALIQQNEVVQRRTAQVMLHYQSAEQLTSLIEPYRDALTPAVAALLQTPHSPVIDQPVPALDVAPVAVPESWDALLFHTGNMLAGRDALDVELFYAGIIARQEEIPADYARQMQPYYKKLMKPWLASTLLSSLRDFFHPWLTGKPAPATESHEQYFPHLINQNRLVLERLRRHSSLSLLATPTHLPFYVSPQALVERLLAHEQQNYPVDTDDLITACNRILPGDIAEKVKQQASGLQGDYAPAIHYLLGITETVSPANNALLPLWAQITRTRHPDGHYPIYPLLAPEQATWPAVAGPFNCDYQVIVDKGEHWTWRRLVINNQARWRYGEKEHYPDPWYYCSVQRDNCCSKADLLYCLSLVPHYSDVFLRGLIPDTASGNEVQEQEDCLFPLTCLLENQLRVHHGGWIYIAVCLLFEKKVSRELAAEYIHLALQQGFLNRTYLSQCIACLLMHQYAPINRFIDYLDGQHHSPAVTSFQDEILSLCVNAAEQDRLPVNFKKLVARYKDRSR